MIHRFRLGDMLPGLMLVMLGAIAGARELYQRSVDEHRWGGNIVYDRDVHERCSKCGGIIDPISYDCRCIDPTRRG